MEAMMKTNGQLAAAIVGCGAIAGTHVAALQANGTPIAALCDTKPEAMARLGLSAAQYTDWQAMLQAGGFDVLHICLPHYLHAPVAVAALERGFHVLCEKPMAIAFEDGQRMVQAAAQSGQWLGVIFQNRYNPASAFVKAALESGRLGRPLAGNVRVNWFRNHAYYTESDWRGRLATEGGGVLINQAIHTFDLMHYFLADHTPLYTEAAAANRAHQVTGVEVEDVVEGLTVYQSPIGTEVRVGFYANTFHAYDAPVMVELCCEGGRVALSGTQATLHFKDGTTEAAPQETDTVAGKSYWGASHVRQIRSFYEAVSRGLAPEIDGAEALKTQALVCAIYQSARTGRRVALS